MDDPYQRGRSPSAGHTTITTTNNNSNQQQLRHTPSPNHAAGPFHPPAGQGLLGDQSTPSFATNTSPYNTGSTNHFDGSQASFSAAGAFNSSTGSFQQPSFSQPGYLDQSLPEGLTASASFDPQGNNLFNSFGAQGLNSQLDPPLFSDLNTRNQFADTSALDPSLITSSPSHNQQSNTAISPTSLMNQMSTQSQTSPTPPHLLSPQSMNRQASSSPHNSPAMQQSAFAPPPVHSRNTSLDPASAAYPQNWNGMSFPQHRRVPSDAHSDVSSSAHPSPYLGNVETFDGSPLLGAQQDQSLYNDVMTFAQFSLNEGQQQPSYISPAHSPHVSPRLLPQQQLPSYTSADNYGMVGGLVPSLNNSYNGVQDPQLYSDQPQEAFPQLNVHPGEAMSPPVITFNPAPPSRQTSFEPNQEEGNSGALSPPESGRSRNRIRAKSDSSLGPRSHSASSGGGRESKDMLSPAAAGVGSRSPSPSGKSRRSSTSSVPNRDYLLGLADPSRSPSEASEGGAGTGSKRTQKHPATFQCSLCPKRFTRAYNLRSHLRTHTDERPFVCSVCGKAFARQHDRKRHESLHSGEKKFVCRGQLKEGGSWGCGRRFARADALGRHFRSEAGRVCIKPLLEEEALERQARDATSGANMLPGQAGFNAPLGFDAYGGMGAPGGGQAWDPNMGGAPPMPFRLPTVILQQYPTLGNIDWNALPPAGPGDYDDEIGGGRSSFDASGGEYDEDDYSGGKSGWASDVGVYGA